MATTKKAAAKPAAKKAPAKRRTKAEIAYDQAMAAAAEMAKGKTAYVIGDEAPYLYMALSDGSLNLVLHQWRECKQTDGTMVWKWQFMQRYASNVAGAMRSFLEDAQREHPRAQATADMATGVDEICKKLDRILKSLQKVATVAKSKE